MATVVNQAPAPQAQADSGLGFLVGLVVLLLAAFLLFYYGVPALRRTGVGGGTNINVPRQIDVNVNQGSQ
jgi:hypothetical protein